MLKRLMTFFVGLPRWLTVIGGIVVTLAFVAAGVQWTGLLKDPKAEMKEKSRLFGEKLKERRAEIDELLKKERSKLATMKDIEDRLRRNDFASLTCQDHDFIDREMPDVHKDWLGKYVPEDIRKLERYQPNSPELVKLRTLMDRYLRGGVASLKCR